MRKADPHTANGTCVRCEVPQFARNHYFTGKLLEARDFVDEQDFHLGKQRRHNQRLHGSGTVCGLKVVQHPNPACRDRYVVVEPGVAIDCCGREIVVEHEQLVDVRALLPAEWFDGVRDGDGAATHVVQICVRYAECGIEEIPVLFDDCAEEGECEPNRILESHDFGVIVDPRPKPRRPRKPVVNWASTLNVARPVRAAVDDSAKRVWVLTERPAALVEFDLSSGALLATRTLDVTPLDVALAPDGETVFVAVADKNGRAAVRGFGSDLDEAGDFSLTPNWAGVTAARAAVDPAGRLWLAAALGTKSVIGLWNDPHDTGAAAKAITHAEGAAMTDAALTTDGSRLVVALDRDQNIVVVRGEGSSLVTAELAVDGKASAVALAETTAGTELYVADADARTVSIYDARWSAAQPLRAVGTPVDMSADVVALAAEPGGRWLYALVAGAAGGEVVAVDTHRAALGEAQAAADPAPVGRDPRALMMAGGGEALYAVYHGSADRIGGVAVLKVSEVSCGAILDRTIDGCPDCEGDCVVLATIADYVPGADFTDDVIDNLADRRILASTEVLTEVVRCLIEHGGGGRGPQGPPGKEGPRGPQGPPGDGLDATYAHICAISWRHAGHIKVDLLRNDPLQVAFDADVRDRDIHSNSFRVLRKTAQGCWCQVDPAPDPNDLRGRLHGINFDTRCKIGSFQLPANPGGVNTLVNGLEFYPDQPFSPGEYRVEILGDLIRDGARGRGLDANHEPPWFPTAGYHSGDRVEGGTFHSYFTVTD
jgi:hypothetical protein